MMPTFCNKNILTSSCINRKHLGRNNNKNSISLQLYLLYVLGL